jgi:peptidoglycan LD-endopeptidase CwlK
MPSFGNVSMSRLVTCHEDLQVLCKDAIKIIDFSILCGHRSTETQIALFNEGKSKLDGVTKKSKHQSNPSRAVDIMPYPGRINEISVWDEPRRFYMLAGVMIGCANKLGISITWGGDWDNDFTFSDQSFHDLPHFELRS